MRRPVLALPALAMIAACVQVDVTDQLERTRADYTALADALREPLATAAEVEREAAIARAVERGSTVIGFRGDCSLRTDLETAAQSHCILREYFDPAVEGGYAGQLTDFLVVLDTYLRAVEGIATTDFADDAQARADALIAAFDAPEEVRVEVFARLGERLRDRQASITALTGYVLERAQVAALIRVLEKGDAFVRGHFETYATAIAVYDVSLETAQAAFVAAESELTNAEIAGEPARHAAAVTAAYAAHAAWEKARAGSTVVMLRNLQRSHASLLARAKGGAGAEEFVAFIEETRALRDAIQSEN